MEILNNFGFDPILFVAQIVNFLILFVVFKKFLYKKILTILKTREEKIRKGIEESEQAHALLANAEDERNEILTTAGKEAEKILDDTKKASTELRDKILAEAKESADKLIAEAKNQARLEMEQVEKRAKETSLAVSEKILDTVLKGLFTKDEKDKILSRSIDLIRKHE